jgi:uncharacterized membrane protein YphA (DoxX/SURF4 family)
MSDNKDRLNTAWWTLRIALGIMPIAAGVDKFFNLLTDWSMYLSPLATRMLPFSATTFMHIVGVIEIIAGIIVLSKWTRIGAYIVMAWLLAIALNLLTAHSFYDLAVRDIELAVAAFVLAQLTAAREVVVSPRIA